MPRYLRRWALVLLCLQLSCAGFLFFRKDHLAAGVKNYQQKKYANAVADFNRCLKKNPGSLVVYQYLYLCYRATNDESKAVYCLLKQIELRTLDASAYRLAYDHYRRARDSKRCFEIAWAATVNVPGRLDEHVPVTREILAFLYSGASVRHKGQDYLAYAEQTGFLKRMPDGNFYPEDRVTIGNLIAVLAAVVPEARVSPPPQATAVLKISPQSFYYRPALKLVAQKIVEPAQLGSPEAYASLSLAVTALNRLKKVVNY